MVNHSQEISKLNPLGVTNSCCNANGMCPRSTSSHQGANVFDMRSKD